MSTPLDHFMASDDEDAVRYRAALARLRAANWNSPEDSAIMSDAVEKIRGKILPRSFDLGPFND